MASGTVKWFNGPSGFGVITDAGGCELFVHRGSLVAAERRWTRRPRRVRGVGGRDGIAGRDRVPGGPSALAGMGVGWRRASARQARFGGSLRFWG